MKDNFEDIKKSFSETPGDFRAEVFAAELIKYGTPREKIYFKPKGSFSRPYNKDIDDIQIDRDDDGDEHIILEVNREGLYDMLPEGLFHFKNQSGAGKGKESVLEKIKKDREEEGYARKFFSPFENEFFQRRLQLELKEKALLQPVSVNNNRELYQNLFGNAASLSDRQLLGLLHVLPMVAHIRGDLAKIDYCLSQFIRYQIQLKRTFQKTINHNQDVPLRLGEVKLGVNAIAGDFFYAYEQHYELHIMGIPKKNITDFFEGGEVANLLDIIMPFLLPHDSKYSLVLHLTKNDRNFYLSDHQESTYLNFDSYL